MKYRVGSVLSSDRLKIIPTTLFDVQLLEEPYELFRANYELHRAFEEAVGARQCWIGKPWRHGDLIFLPLNKRLFDLPRGDYLAKTLMSLRPMINEPAAIAYPDWYIGPNLTDERIRELLRRYLQDRDVVVFGSAPHHLVFRRDS